jgi:hypothetical protein
MKCPNCDHVSDTVLLKCSACGETFERAALEQLGHLDYLLHWLANPTTTLDSATCARVYADVSLERAALKKRLTCKPAAAVPAAAVPAASCVAALPRAMAVAVAAAGWDQIGLWLNLLVVYDVIFGAVALMLFEPIVEE